MPAPIGNKYALGNNGGRPRIYDNPDDLLKECDAYFDYIKKVKEPATITGLALYLGFANKQSLLDYEQNEVFSVIIKKAKARVEHEYEKKLFSKNVTGAIFALKNMTWRDKSESDINVTTPINLIFNPASGNDPLPE